MGLKILGKNVEFGLSKTESSILNGMYDWFKKSKLMFKG